MSLDINPIILSAVTNNDITDLLWGNFITDREEIHEAPDLVILSYDNNPSVIVGTPLGESWSLLPNGQPQYPVELIDLDGYPAHKAAIWCAVNDANERHIVLYTSAMLSVRLIIDFSPTFSMIGARVQDAWYSIALAPPSATASNSVFDCNIISGNSWKPGVATWFERLGTGWDEDLLIPARSGQYHVEFVSDMELFVSHSLRPPRCFLGLSEAGQLMLENDSRNRHTRLMEIELDNGLWDSVIPLSEEPDLPNGQKRPEAFSVTWCPFQNTRNLIVEFTEIDNLFRINEGNKNLTGFEPVYGINSSIIIRADGTLETAWVWYSGNGWFGITEPLNEDDVLRLDILTADEAELILGRRGCIESWQVF